MAATENPGEDVLAHMDDFEVTALHWKIMFISGMGFFKEPLQKPSRANQDIVCAGSWCAEVGG